MKEFTRQETRTWMSTLEKRMSSGAVALRASNDRVVVVKAVYKRYWSFPGGVVDRGETPRQAAAREAHEEVGINVSPETLTFRLVADRVSEIAQTYQFVFEAPIHDSDLTKIVLDEHEIAEYDIVTRQQILDNDRYYSESTRLWAEGNTGYHEQIFHSAPQADI